MESADYHISNIDKQKVKEIIVSFNDDIKSKKESYLLDNISSIITFLISLAGLITTICIKKKE